MKLNHVLVLTSDLQAMRAFWLNVIGLHEGWRPDFPFAGLWLYFDETPLIHIAEQQGATFSYGALSHVALEGANYKELLSRCQQFNQTYTEKDVPESGERQVFLSGPDGLTVEMLFLLQSSNNVDSDYKAGED
jgi:lactoylglutathione lyase